MKDFRYIFFINVGGDGRGFFSDGNTSTAQGGGKGGDGYVKGEWVGGIEVGLEVAVVFVEALRDLGTVEVILGGVRVQI